MFNSFRPTLEQHVHPNVNIFQGKTLTENIPHLLTFFQEAQGPVRLTFSVGPMIERLGAEHKPRCLAVSAIHLFTQARNIHG